MKGEGGALGVKILNSIRSLNTVISPIFPACEKKPRRQLRKPELPLRAADVFIDSLMKKYQQVVTLYLSFMPTLCFPLCKTFGPKKRKREREREIGLTCEPMEIRT